MLVSTHALGCLISRLLLTRAAQAYGIYAADRGGDGGITIKAGLNAPDATYPGSWKDAGIIIKLLQQVTNNSSVNTGSDAKSLTNPTKLSAK